MALASPASRMTYIAEAERALAPIDGFAAIEPFRAALRHVGIPAIDFAWSGTTPHNLLAAAADWAGANTFLLVRRDQHEGRSSEMLPHVQFRPVALDSVRVLDLEEAAPVAVIAVLGAVLDEVSRDRLSELAAQSRGLPLVLLSPAPLADNFIAELGQSMEVRRIVGLDALLATDLVGVLGGASPDERRSAAQVVTAQRLLLAAQCLLLREQRRCEGEMLRIRPLSPAAGTEASFATLAAEVTVLRPMISSAFERGFQQAAEAFAPEGLSENDVVISLNKRSHERAHAVSDAWLEALRGGVHTTATAVLGQSTRFVDRRIEALSDRVRTAAAVAAQPRPTPVPTLNRHELIETVARRVSDIAVAPELMPERNLGGLVSRHNPLGVIQPLLPLIGFAAMVLPSGVIDSKDAASFRQTTGLVVMGIGALFYLISIIRAVPHLRIVRIEDRAQARRNLIDRSTAAGRKALTDIGAQTSGQATRWSETVNNWFAATTTSATLRQPLANTVAIAREQALASHHRNLVTRLRTIADTVAKAP